MMENLSKLKTEQVHPESRGIHKKSAGELLRLLFKYQLRTVDVVEAQINEIAEIANQVSKKLKTSNGRIYGVGAGTSIRLLVQSLIEVQHTDSQESELSLL